MVKFLYSVSEQNKNRDKVVQHLINLARNLLQLPDNIIVEYKNLLEHVYAETSVSSKNQNRITLNTSLNEKDVIKPLIHELIHLEQTYTGRLAVYKSGHIFWEGKLYITEDQLIMSYTDYRNLPWELDVTNREKAIFEQIIRMV